MARFFQYQAKTEPVTVPQAAAAVVAVAFMATEVFFPRSIIYQSKAEPIPVPSVSVVENVTRSSPVIYQGRIINQPLAYVPAPTESITVDKWLRPLSEPVKVRKLATSQYQSLAFQFQIPEAPIGAVPVYSDGPPSSFRQFQYQSTAQAPFTPTVTAVVTSAVSSQVTYKSKFIYQTDATPLFVGETVTVDKWFRPFSEPKRLKQLSVAQQQSFTTDTAVIPTSKFEPWFAPLSEPVRQKQGLKSNLQQSYTSGYLPDSSKFIEGWYQPLSTPTRINKTAHQQQASIWSTFTPTAAAFTYFNLVQGDTGLTFEKTIIYQVNAEALNPAINVFWDHSWVEPPRRISSHATQQDLFWSTFTPAVTPPVTAVTPAAVSSEVTFPKSIIYQAHTEPVFTPVSVVVEVTTFSTQISAQSKFIYQSQAYTPFVPVTPQDIGFPIPTVTGAVSFSTTTIYQESAEVNLTVNEIAWLTPLNEPVRVKRLPISEYPSLAWGGFTPPFTDIRWQEPWSDPVRIRQKVAFSQDLFWSGFTPTPVALVATAAYSSQVTFKTRFIYQTDAYTPFTPTVTDTRWYQPWSEPVRIKRGLRAEEQQSLAWANFTPPFTDVRWYEPLSEPVKLRRFPTAEQQALIWGPTPIETIREDKWYQSWSEPVRFKKGLGAPYQQTLAIDTVLPPAASKLPTWWYSWSEPVRKKPGLRPDEQQFLAQPSLVIPPPPFVTLVEAIEPMVVYERFFIYDPQTSPVFSPTVVTVTMFATETNSDIASFEINVSGKAVRASVSIKEIPRGDDAYASIEET